jgi:hypothetical protein
MAGLLALLAIAGAAVFAVAGAGAQTPTPLAARLAECTTGERVADRAATFTASMPAISGARRLGMRFTFEVREPGERRYSRITLGSWRRWERADPGRPGFIYSKRVEGLTGPAVYRAVVRFRWTAADGHVLRRARRVTRGCRQPGPPPAEPAPASAAP